MYLSIREILKFDEDKLREFLQAKIKEGLYLDYKQALPDNKKDAYREFLKDVTAFANAHGGHIIIGVKEPSDDLELDNQVIGIDRGDTVAQDLERLASSSIDPRIPGLKIVPISLSTDRYILIVHIPPSLGRPHMVNYEGHRSFYVRHWESSFPMTAYEVRDAVVASLSAEAKAIQYLEQEEIEAKQYLIKGPSFLIQAIPMISLEQPWPVLEEPFVEIIRRPGKRSAYPSWLDLASDVAPTPTIYGIMGRNNREDPSWITEVHRNGYVSVLFYDIERKSVANIDKKDLYMYCLHKGYCDLFRSFCAFLSEIWAVSKTDLPYLLRCKYIKALNTVFMTQDRLGFRDFTEPYKRDEIKWPYHYRQVGQDPQEIAEKLCEEMFNAFGLKYSS